MEFTKYPKVHNAARGDTLYSDVINHCKSYRNFIVSGSKITSCHEVTHGCNSEIRNKSQGRVNAFYVGNDRAVIIPEPNIRKRDIVPYIPAQLRSYRYNQYVVGQAEWDDTPLYIYDEFVAYVNGAWAAIELKKMENYVEHNRVIDGPIEFVSYAVGVLMATQDKTNFLNKTLSDFSKWLFQHAYNSYFEVKNMFGTSFDHKLYEEQKQGSSWNLQRKFLKDKLDFSVP